VDDGHIAVAFQRIFIDPKKKHDWVKHCKEPIFVDKLQYVIGFGVHFYVLKHQNLVCTTTIFATPGFMNSQPPAS